MRRVVPATPAVMAGTLMAVQLGWVLVRSSGEVWRWPGWWLTPLKNDKVRQLGWWNSQYMEKIKHVPNHQPALVHWPVGANCQWCWLVGTETLLLLLNHTLHDSWQAAQWSREEVTKMFHYFSRLFVVQWKGWSRASLVFLSLGRSWKFTFFCRFRQSMCLAGALMVWLDPAVCGWSQWFLSPFYATDLSETIGKERWVESVVTRLPHKWEALNAYNRNSPGHLSFLASPINDCSLTKLTCPMVSWLQGTIRSKWFLVSTLKWTGFLWFRANLPFNQSFSLYPFPPNNHSSSIALGSSYSQGIGSYSCLIFATWLRELLPIWVKLMIDLKFGGTLW